MTGLSKSFSAHRYVTAFGYWLWQKITMQIY